MKKIFRLIVLVLLVSGWAVAAASLHVVRDGNRVIVIPKQRLQMREIYVDTTKWTLDDVARHPAVVQRLIETGKVDVLQHVVPEATGESLNTTLRAAMERGPQSAPATRPVIQISV